MSFRIEYDFPARWAFDRIPWPRSATVDAIVQRFARERAPSLASRAYPLRGGGYRIAVRVDLPSRTVLVLHIEPL